MDGRFVSKRQQWLSPSRLPLLVLIRNLCLPEPKHQEFDELSECVGRLRHALSLLLLELIQAPELEPSGLRQRLVAIDNSKQLHNQLIKRLREIVEEGIDGLYDFFHSLNDLFAGKELALHKTSLFGIFMRRHVLLFHKMTFSQVGHFLRLLENYVAAIVPESQVGTQSIDQGGGQTPDQSFDISMESLSGADGEKKTNEHELIRIPGKNTVSSQQAEYFLAQQAACIQCNESAALDPPELQAKITALLAASPDIAEAHYVSHLNSVRVSELNAAMENLYRYYEKQQWSGDSVANGRMGAKSEETDEEKCRRFRYAALNLASLHCQFGHKNEALAALKEAIQITQETSDHVCLEHCLGWLLRLEEDGSQHSKALLDRYVARAAELKLPYLTSLSLLTHTRYGCMAGMSPPKVFQALSQVDIINAQNSLEDLTATAHAQYSSVWHLYGKRQVAAIFCQLCPSQLQSPAGARFDVWVNKPGSAFTGELDLTRDSMHSQDGEAFCLSLCELAQIHVDQGMFTEALAILDFLKLRFPKHSKQAQLGLMTRLKLKYRRSLLQNDWKTAEETATQMRPIHKLEAEYRLAVLMICRGQYTQAYDLLSRLLDKTRDKSSVNEGKESAMEYQAGLLLAMAQLFIATDDVVSALPFLLKCLTIASSHFMDDMKAKATLHIAYVQLMLDQPGQAQALARSVMVQILAHGCLHLQCSAQFLLIKCQLASARDENRKAVLLSALQTLEKVLAGFVKLQAKYHITEVNYHKCMMYDELDYVSERNQCAKECCDMLDGEQSSAAPSIFCLP